MSESDQAISETWKKPNLKLASDANLLGLYVDVLDALRDRGLTRSTNNPVADYAELLCAKALGLARSSKSTKGYDGTDASGRRIEVKARRVTAHNSSRQLGAIRGLDKQPFDWLAGVLFHEDLRVWKACFVPHSLVLAVARYVPHTNSWMFVLRDEVWSLAEVEDLTARLELAQRGGDSEPPVPTGR